jgi:hypothetical protein
MSVTRDDVHRLVDAIPAGALPIIEPYLRRYAGVAGRSVEQQLADAGLLEEVEPLEAGSPDPAAVAAARRSAGQGKALAEYVVENR